MCLLSSGVRMTISGRIAMIGCGRSSALLVVALIASAACAATQPRELMLCDFETHDGGLNLGSEFPGAEGQFTVVAAAAHDGKQGGRLSFDLTKGALCSLGAGPADTAGCGRTKPVRLGPRRCRRTACALQDPRRNRPGPHAARPCCRWASGNTSVSRLRRSTATGAAPTTARSTGQSPTFRWASNPGPTESARSIWTRSRSPRPPRRTSNRAH